MFKFVCDLCGSCDGNSDLFRVEINTLLVEHEDSTRLWRSSCNVEVDDNVLIRDVCFDCHSKVSDFINGMGREPEPKAPDDSLLDPR